MTKRTLVFLAAALVAFFPGIELAQAAEKASRAQALQATDAVAWLSRLPAFPRGFHAWDACFDPYGYEFMDPEYPMLYGQEHARHLECLIAVDVKRAFWRRLEDALPFETELAVMFNEAASLRQQVLLESKAITRLALLEQAVRLEKQAHRLATAVVIVTLILEDIDADEAYAMDRFPEAQAQEELKKRKLRLRKILGGIQ